MSQIPVSAEMISDGTIIGARSMRLIYLATLVNLREVFARQLSWISYEIKPHVQYHITIHVQSKGIFTNLYGRLSTWVVYKQRIMERDIHY